MLYTKLHSPSLAARPATYSEAFRMTLAQIPFAGRRKIRAETDGILFRREGVRDGGGTR